MLNTPVRKIIERMRKCGSHTIICNNKTKIIIQDLGLRSIDQPISKIKWNPDGSMKVMRRFFVTIVESPRSVMKYIPKNKNHWLYEPESNYNFFNENDYYLTERELNEFISDNDDVDIYETCCVHEYMLADMEDMYKEFEESMA